MRKEGNEELRRRLTAKKLCETVTSLSAARHGVVVRYLLSADCKLLLIDEYATILIHVNNILYYIERFKTDQNNVFSIKIGTFSKTGVDIILRLFIYFI